MTPTSAPAPPALGDDAVVAELVSIRAQVDLLLEKLRAGSAHGQETSVLQVPRQRHMTSTSPRAGRTQHAPATAPPVDTRQPATSELPFVGYEDIRASKKTAARRAFEAATVSQLHAAVAYETANEQRRQIIEMIEVEITKREDTPPIPLAQWNSIRSNNHRRSRTILGQLDAQQLRDLRTYEETHAVRRQVIALIEDQLRFRGEDVPVVDIPDVEVPPVPPVKGWNQLRSSDEAGSRKILSKGTPEQLRLALAYEHAHDNRSRILLVIASVLRRKEVATPPVLPEIWNRVRSKDHAGTRTALREIADAQLAEVFEFEHRTEHRRQVLILIRQEAQRRGIVLTEPDAPRRPETLHSPPVAAEPSSSESAQPWPGYDALNTARRSEARTDFAERSVTELAAALQYEQAGRNRTVMVSMLQAALKKRSPAVPTADLPWAGYNKVVTTDRTRLRRDLAKRTPDELRDAIKYERAGRNSRVMLSFMETALRKHEAATPTGAVSPVAETPDLPWDGYDKVVTTDRTRLRREIAARHPDQIRAAIEHERVGRNSRVMVSFLETALRKNTAVPTPLFPSGALAGRHSNSSQPWPEYDRQIRASDRTGARRTFKTRTEDELRTALEHEQTNQRRKVIVEMLEHELGRRRASQSKVVLPPGSPGEPWAGYDDLNTKRRTEARIDFAKRSVPELRAAIEYERGTRGSGVMITMLNAGLNKALAATPPEGTATKPPFPQFAQLNSKRETASRKILASKSDQQLHAAYEWEVATRDRAKIKRLIEMQLRKRGLSPAEPASNGAMRTASNDEPLPFAGYDMISDRQSAREMFIAHTVAVLEEVSEYEKAHANRAAVLAELRAVIASKRRPARTRARTPDGPPVEQQDNLQEQILERTIQQGHLDDRLDEIIEWEDSHLKRSRVIVAARDRLAERETGRIVSPVGRRWKGREPFVGYGTINHSDEVALRASLQRRSSRELRQARRAEERQDIPSKEATQVIDELLEHRSRQPVAA